MKKLNKFADYPGLREFGLDKNQAEKICKEVFDSKRLNFSFFKNIAGYSSAYSGFFSENFKYALETYLFRNKDDKNKIYAVIITYDIKNKNDYKAYYKEIEFSSEIVPESYMMNNEKFISDYNKYSFYEEYLKNKKKVGKKMKRLIKAENEYLTKIKNSGKFNDKQIQEISYAVNGYGGYDGLSNDLLDILANPDFNVDQMIEVRLSLFDYQYGRYLTLEQCKYLANPNFSANKIKELRNDFEDGKTINDLKKTSKLVKKALKFNELKKNVQEDMIQQEYETWVEEIKDLFDKECNEKINEKFPNSDIEYTYSLNYSQGDGFGLMGSIDIDDALNLTNITFNQDEKDLFDNLNNNGEGHRASHEIRIFNPRRSTFFNDNMIDVIYNKKDIKETAEEVGIDIDINDFYNKLKQFDAKLKEVLDQFCYDMEKRGYELLDNLEKDIKEDIILRDENYDEDGNVIF